MDWTSLALHIAHLAQQHNIEIISPPGITVDQAQALHFQMLDGIFTVRQIYTVPITDPVSYGTALHELGHHIRAGAMVPIDPTLPPAIQISQKIDQEDLAWDWARSNALIWNAEMEADARKARETYRLHVERVVKAMYIRSSNHRSIREWK
jgi:hypothetical protein